MKTKTKEIITERSVTISVKGTSKQNINAAMTKAFDHVLKQLLDADRYRGKKSIGKNKMTWAVQEQAKFIEIQNDQVKKNEAAGNIANDTASMNKHEKAVRIFMDWMKTGLRLPDVELAFECCQDAEYPAPVSAKVSNAIENLMEALVHFRSINQLMINEQLKRQKVVNLYTWKKSRTACSNGGSAA